jgi:hypothetical protein
MRGLALAQMDESVHLRRELDALASLLPDEEQDSVLLEEVSWRRGHQFVGWPALLALTKRRLVLVQKRRLRKGMRIASIPYNEIEIFSTRREANAIPPRVTSAVISFTEKDRARRHEMRKWRPGPRQEELEGFILEKRRRALRDEGESQAT